MAAGATEPARLIRLAYEPRRPATATVALVGKGITFDSGGLSLKTPDGMMTMKDDMGGAAAVIAAMGAIAALGSPARVVAYACAAPRTCRAGPRSTRATCSRPATARPSRCSTPTPRAAWSWPTACSLAVEDGPDAIIDLATLTGGQRVALGDEVAAVMSNHDGLAAAVEAAGRRAGEPLWRLPLWPGYRSHLDSDVADIKNIGRANTASTIIGGLFLQEFVSGRPWAHLDIASPSWSDRDEGWITKGATGWGVRTLVELLRSFAPLSS